MKKGRFFVQVVLMTIFLIVVLFANNTFFSSSFDDLSAATSQPRKENIRPSYSDEIINQNATMAATDIVSVAIAAIQQNNDQNGRHLSMEKRLR
jgi:flagellar basal body-associated protein FliL